MPADHRFVGSAKLIGALTLASRILGLLREVIFSHFFGASPLLSAFRVAFQLPNLARRLFGEGALTSSFIPVFTRTRQTDGEHEARRLTGAVLTLLGAVLGGILLIAELGLFITSYFVWGPTLRMSAILLPYMALICLTAFFAGVLNALDQFAGPAAAPMILNVLLIAATWIGGSVLRLSTDTQFILVTCSVLVAGVLQLALQLWYLRRCGFAIDVNLNWSSPVVRRIVVLMGPMVLGLSVVQISTFVDSLIALFMVPDGRGPAILGYAQYLCYLPLGIFGTALATAIFPLLSQRMAAGDRTGFRHALETAIRTGLFISIPAGAGLILIGEPLVRLLFEHGEFDPGDTRRVTLTLAFYCLGLWAYTVQQILVRAFYSMEDCRTPVRIAVPMLGLNVVLNIALVSTSLQEAGVALATAITAVIQTALLAATLNARLDRFSWRGTILTGARCLLATGLMASVVLVLRGQSPLGELVSLGDGSQVAASMAAGAAVYFAATRVMRLEELSILFRGRVRS